MKHLYQALFACLIVASAMAATFASAHSGGTNGAGCHAGSQPYHCH